MNDKILIVQFSTIKVNITHQR